MVYVMLDVLNGKNWPSSITMSDSVNYYGNLIFAVPRELEHLVNGNRVKIV